MTNEEKEKYYKAYYDNEANANKHMVFANALAAILMLAIWIMYLVGAFEISSNGRPVINVLFPLSVLVLLTPLLHLWKFKELLRTKGYKYFLIFIFVMVVAAMNVIIPKHALLAWALCIIITSHYYNPRLCRVTFITILSLMLVCIYLALFIGEYDPNLIGEGLVIDGKVTYIDGAVNRYNLLVEMLLGGENRFLKVFVFYYIPRSLILLLIFIVCNSLNMRTYKLLVQEISVNSEQEKTRTELEVAKEIQLSTLSSNFVTSEEIEILAELKAAKEVGGDFYDCIEVDKNHTAIVIGDVSGKGIPAAMFMMKTITCFKNFCRKNRTPAQILKDMNKAIYDGNNSQMFVTCFIAILDHQTGELMYANAGHNPPIVGSNRHYRYLKCKTGFILGGLEEAMVEDETTTLKPGESITLYTDGVTEARDSKGGFYSEERLIQTFNKIDYTCLVELHHTIKDDVDFFVGNTPQSDDLTLITMKYHGDKYSYSEWNFDAQLENIPAALKFIENFCEEHKLSKEFRSNLLVVGDELISNIVKYGYEYKGGDIFVRLLYNVDKKEFVLTVIDTAPAFNQLEVNNDKVSENPENQKVGGLGILIVKKIMSQYAYDRINGKNILVLRKKF